MAYAPRGRLKTREKYAIGVLNCDELATWYKPGYKAICQSLFRNLFCSYKRVLKKGCLNMPDFASETYGTCFGPHLSCSFKEAAVPCVVIVVLS